MKVIPDQAQREQALNPVDSFIVQAPAGSGKTELLVQRVLSLLALGVKQPEEILAITFTRKAAHEMRCRIIDALVKAQQPKGQVSTQAKTRELALQVLAQDKAQNWQLIANPNRLMIQTIDALCMRLTQQMPVLSGIGGDVQIAAAQQVLYQDSVTRVLSSLERETPWQAALQRVFMHFDNQYAVIESVFMQMLGKRDQWLPYLYRERDPTQLRAHLELCLQQIICESLRQANAALAALADQNFLNLLNGAAVQAPEDSPIKTCASLQALPGMEAADLNAWQAVVHFLLSQSGTPRKRVDKSIGFPAASSLKDKDLKAQAQARKQAMQAFLNDLAEKSQVVAALNAVRALPPATYSEASWAILQDLWQVLPIMVAELTLTFQQQGQVDFIEIAQRALQALGDETAPTDLALVLDHQLKHILVDEFQDTSISQYRLLEKLVQGWQPDDGRTLFLVGDPMQSIYRFRQANVGLFLQAQADGINNVYLTPLQLMMNFRSDPQLIDWINQAMPDIMPHTAQISAGAIPFTPCVPGKPAQAAATLSTQLMLDETTQAHAICTQIKQIQQMHPEWRIALLVRARSHLPAILAALQQAGVAYQAVEIESLAQRPIVQDLLALTCALLHEADSLAWLALLRSPWCGLTLAELNILQQQAHTTTLWQFLTSASSDLPFEPASLLRLQRFITAIQATLAARDRLPLTAWVKSAWFALGQSPTATAYDAADIEAFWLHLDFIADNYHSIDGELVQTQMAARFADQIALTDNPVQVMTIHKSKGLEFDAVFLPSLERKPPVSDQPLLRSIEQATEHATSWLLAPVHGRTDEADPVYQYLARLEKNQQAFETQRLLYVALTRAKQQLYLSACFDGQNQDKPPAGSLLALLWPYWQAGVETTPVTETAQTTQDELQRLPADWQLPAPWLDWLHDAPKTLDENPLDVNQYRFESLLPRHVGTLMHRCIRYLTLQPHEGWDAEKIQAHFVPRWQQQLLAMGIPQRFIAGGVAVLVQAIENMLSDPRGQWLLTQHQADQCEMPIQAHLVNETQRVILDRTFIDASDRRWIIDYKSSAPQPGQSREDFLQAERETYQPQLQYYAKVMAERCSRPIHLALYYPLIPAWDEWS